MNNKITANIIIIGNEILSGRTIDTNINYLARELTSLGIELSHVRVIADEESEIVDNVRELKDKCTYLFTTGGIGPTHDDITSNSIAKALNLKFIRNKEAELILCNYYGDQINEARLSMADMPEGAKLIENPISKAPGFIIENIFVFAGVPKIARAMFDNIRTLLARGADIHSKSLIFNKGEGLIADMLTKLQKENPQVSIGSYPFFKEEIWGTEIVMRSIDKDKLELVFKEINKLI